MWRLLGVAYSSLGTHGGHESAENAFERVVTLAPSAARNHFNLAVAQQALNKTEAARQSLERTLALEPTYEQARVRLQSLPSAANVVSPPPPVVAASLEAAAPLGGMGALPSLASVGSVFAPPQPDSGGTTNLGGGNAMGLMGVGEDRGFASPSTPSLPHAGEPVAAAGGWAGMGGSPGSIVPNLRPAESVPGAPTGSIFYDQMSRAESNAYLTGAYSISNTSGMQGTVPPEIASGFNWGAAVFPFWWLRNHNLQAVSIGFAVFFMLLRGVVGQVHMLGADLVIMTLQIILFFVMGFMGNRIGWQNRKFDDEDDFRACQRIWALWAIPRIVLELVGVYFILAAAQAVNQTMGSGGGMNHRGF